MSGWDLTREYPQGYDNWLYAVGNGDTLLGFAEWLRVDMGTTSVVDNVTGDTIRRFTSESEAEQLCRGLNLQAGPGGRYAIRVPA